MYIIFICIKNIQCNSFFSNYFHRIQNQTHLWLLIRRTRTNRNTKRSSQTDIRPPSHCGFTTRVSSHLTKAHGKHMSSVISPTLHMHLTILCLDCLVKKKTLVYLIFRSHFWIIQRDESMNVCSFVMPANCLIHSFYKSQAVHVKRPKLWVFKWFQSEEFHLIF